VIASKGSPTVQIKMEKLRYRAEETVPLMVAASQSTGTLVRVSME